MSLIFFFFFLQDCRHEQSGDLSLWGVHKSLRELDPKVHPPTELCLFPLHETRDFSVSVEVHPDQEPSKEQLFPSEGESMTYTECYDNCESHSVVSRP